MKSNKKYIYILIAICIVVLIWGIAYFVKRNTSVNENTVTRYEWLEMLGEQYGINEYTNESPYFQDVDSDNPYFAYVQSAVEWKVIDTDSDFDGEHYASGQFIALTAMKTIGESKFKIYFGAENDITDDAYIELAVDHGLIEEEKLKKGFSKEECEQILENLRILYFGEFWKDDYSDVTYKKDVIELSSDDVLRSNSDGSEIVVTDDKINSFEVGDIIVFEQNNTKIKFARKITGINSDGTLSLRTVELDKVVETLTVSDITELTFEDIVNYYGLENLNAVNDLKCQQTGGSIVNTSVFSANINSKGYKLSLSTEDEDDKRYLKVQITDNATGISYTLPISDKVEADCDYSAEINIDKLCIGGQVNYSTWNGLEYAEAAVDAHATFNGTIKAEKDKKFLLCKTPVPLGNGIVGADIQIYLVLSVEGNILFEAELPVEVSVSYEKDKGLKNFRHDFSVEEPTIEANCDASAKLRLEPTFVILGCLNVMDAEADIGVSASAEIVTRSNSQICADISVSFPVMTLSVCGDDDADTIIGDLGLSAEWEIISSDDAPIQFGMHYELLPDKTVQFVDECTYGEEQNLQTEAVRGDILKEGIKEEKPSTSSEGGATFTGYLTYELPMELYLCSPIEDRGSYYMVRGNLKIDYCISCNKFTDELKEGESFTLQDKQFIKGKFFKAEGFSLHNYEVYCVDDDSTYYICGDLIENIGSRFRKGYYTLCYEMPDPDFMMESMRPVSNDFGELAFQIKKDAFITSIREFGDFEWAAREYDPSESEMDIFNADEEQRKESLALHAHTLEECIKNEILLDDWWDIATNSSIYGEMDGMSPRFYVTFDENGMIDTMIMDSFY